MSDTHNFKKLKAHILNLSEADNFDDAKSEWSLDRVCVTEEFGQCPCGKKIKEHCYLKNGRNENTTWVGNVCVRRFMNIDSGTLFDGLRRVRGNNSARPNNMLIEYAWSRGNLFGESEYKFLRDISGRRWKLSEKQLHWLQKINRRIVQSIVVLRVPDQIVITDDDESELESSNDGMEAAMNE